MIRRIKNIGKVFIVSTVFALALRLFLIEDYRIASNSMQPTLTEGDLVFISKAAFNIRLPFSTYEVVKFRRPVPGDVVAFTVPDKGIETFVKRVVAGEGDLVQIRNGILSINGKEAKIERAVSSSDGTTEVLPNGSTYKLKLQDAAMKDFGPIDVPKGHFFAMGDNRNESIDSRAWGPVPYSCLKGRLGWVWWSKRN